MPADFFYRVAIVLIICLVAPIGGYFRRKAAASGSRVSHKEEGYWFAALLRFCGVLLWIAVLAYLIKPQSIHWAALPLPSILRWTGAVLGIACAGLFYWTLSSLGNNLTDTVVTRSNATLITFGPYRWVRHPFYVTAALLMTSVFLLSANWLIALSSIVVMSLLYIRTPKEEQALVDRFGDQYVNYMVTTGRFIPHFFRKR